MQKNTEDVMLVDPDRGFTMAFFNSPKIKELNLQAMKPYIVDAEYGTFNSPDGYDCQVLADEKYRMILMVGIHADGHMMIRSELRPLELSIALKRVPPEVRQLINSALKNHLPDITHLSDVWFKSSNEEEVFQAALPIINAIPRKIVSQSASFSTSDAFNIMQAEYGITKYDSDCPILASVGAGPCVILSVYNEQARKGFLSHIDDAIDLNEISACIFQMRDDANQPLVAHMVGGWSDTYHMVADIALRLEEQPNIKLIGWNEPDNVTLNLALDSRNGNLYKAFSADQVDSGPMIKERDNRIVSSFFNGGVRPPLCSYHYISGRNTTKDYTR